jgi:hypothetical protein
MLPALTSPSSGKLSGALRLCLKRIGFGCGAVGNYVDQIDHGESGLRCLPRKSAIGAWIDSNPRPQEGAPQANAASVGRVQYPYGAVNCKHTGLYGCGRPPYVVGISDILIKFSESERMF